MKFTHFPQNTVRFLQDLAKNNNKDWFAENRSRYDSFFLAPAVGFVNEIAPKLQEISPDVVCEAKIDRSIFRIYKDARRHRGQAPFKTHLGLVFWLNTEQSRVEAPCYYFHLEPPFYSAGVGIAYFTPEFLQKFRTALTTEKYAQRLQAILDTAKRESWEIEGNMLKKLPKGFEPVAGYENLLLYKSLYLSDETPINSDFYKDDFLDRIVDIYKKMSPYYEFLKDIMRS